MGRRVLSVVVLVALAAGFSMSLGLAQRRPPIDWFFLTVVVSAGLLVGRTTWSAFRAGRRQWEAAAALDRLDLFGESRRAVIEERRRLQQDIEAGIRDSLATIGRMAAALDEDVDPRPTLVAIRIEATEATTDVRRRLGLLRADHGTPSIQPRTPSDSAPRLRRPEWVLTAAVVVVGAVDVIVFTPMEGLVPTPLEVALSLCAAGTLLWRRRAPLVAAVACAAILAGSAVAHEPVLDGFWLALTVGLLAWSCAAVATPRAWIVVGLLAGCAVGSRLASPSGNGPILLVLCALAVTGGATFGHSRRRQNVASARAGARRGELQAAGAEAVAAERRVVARELHDVVSHALSVIAVQAGAAEVSWPADPAASQRAVEVIFRTANQAVAELDRLVPGRTSNRHDVADVRDLADRMRAAQLEVSLDLAGEPSAPVPETVYRVVQETLTNVLRHAPGSHVDVRIQPDGDRILVRVTDDGPGSAPASPRGYGLIGLTERLRQGGGTLVTRSRPDVDGFEVTAVLPSAAAAGAP